MEFGEVFTIVRVLGLAAEGTIDPLASDKDILRSITRDLRRMQRAQREGEIEFLVSVDHRIDLLREARRYRRSNSLGFAALAYGTWCEHWLNSWLATAAEDRGMDAKEVKDMLRSSPLRGKVSWLWMSLGLPRINESHVDRINALSEKRNAYAHYKWVAIEVRGAWEAHAAFKRFLEEFDKKTVRYLQAYEARHRFKGQKKRLQSLASRWWKDALNSSNAR